MMIAWNRCHRDFEVDAGLCDIYVHNVTIAEWRAVFDALIENYSLEYSVDNVSQPLPESVDAAFAIKSSAMPALYFHAGRVLVGCHFYWDEEIEFDIDLSEVTSQEALDDLLRFIRLLGQTTRRAVTLTRENDEKRPFIIYDAVRKDFDYLG
jgi:hypothetical protein